MVRRITADDRELSITTGEHFSVELDSNPTTGYEWEINADQKALRLINQEVFPFDTATGTGGIECFTFEPLRTGRTELQFLSRRRWTKNVRRTIVFLVHITESQPD